MIITEGRQKVPVTDAEYQKQLLRLIDKQLEITVPELCELVRPAPRVRVYAGLKLHNIMAGTGIMSQIESGKINAAKAYCIAHLPTDIQREWADKAMITDTSEFIENDEFEDRVFDSTLHYRIKQLFNKAMAAKKKLRKMK